MNREHTEYLIKTYPDLYAGCFEPPSKSNMAFGFECGDGWFNIIKDLSEKLEPMGVIASQIKEKWGSLRFYVYQGTDEAWDLIDVAEELAEKTCEECGKPGKLRSDHGWLTTQCEGCHNDSKKD